MRHLSTSARTTPPRPNTRSRRWLIACLGLLLGTAAPAAAQSFLKGLLNDAVNNAIDKTGEAAKGKMGSAPKPSATATTNEASTEMTEGSSVPAAPNSAPAKMGTGTVPRRSSGSLEYSDGELLQARVVSVKRNGGTLDVVMEYTNLANNDCKITIDTGKPTVTCIVDNQGGQWTYLTATKGGTRGTKDMLFQQGIPTRVPLRFNLAAGNAGASSFNLVNWIKISYPDRSASPRALKVDIRNLPSNL